MAERKQGGEDIGVKTGIITQTKPKTQKPSLYRVLILNDDYTPMEFVVYVLERFFNKSPPHIKKFALKMKLLLLIL